MPIEQGDKGTKPETLGESSTSTETERLPSLREVAEASWDEVMAAADEGDQDTTQVDDGGPLRDARGRFASKEGEPGEAEQPTAPSPDQQTPEAPDAAKPVDPALGSNQPPQHWSEQDRQMFGRLPEEGQAFLLRRHTEMERDYQSKAQANATAVQFTDAVGQMFQDPVLQHSVQQSGLSPFDMIQTLLGMQRRGMHPDPREKMGLLVDIARNIGLDPAAVFATSQPGTTGPTPQLSEADLKDPAIKFFADHLGRTSSELQGLRNQLQSMQRQGHEAAQAEAFRVTKWGIDSFAEAKDAQGNLLHPHFDAVLPQVIELFRANPKRDLKEAYETAIWMSPQTRGAIQQAEAARAAQDQANRRAAQAARSNLRGRTQPVAKPNGAGDGEPRTLRQVIEASADEIGF